uniref:Endoplasmic reticulum vesicle transporter C-terminal domain-containing protein n=1 Tax=Paramoeba aestuarina TaxID=180227 RepID=A0A7S4KYL0_9EUKA
MSFLSESTIHKLDFYPKIAEEYRVRTLTGAILSLCTLLFILFLFHSEMKDYLKVRVTPELKVDTSFGELIRINVDIAFPALACDYLTVDVVDAAGGFQMDITDNIVKQRYSQHGNLVGGGNEKSHVDKKLLMQVPETKPGCPSCYGAEKDGDHCCHTCDDVHQAYALKGWKLESDVEVAQCKNEDLYKQNTANEGCSFKGHLLVNKVRGQFHFSPGKSLPGLDHGHRHAALSENKYNVSHTINHLSFGADFPGHVNPLDGVTKISSDPFSASYTYFTIVVPTTYSSLNGEIIQSSQYSVTEHSRPIPKPQRNEYGHQHLLPGVFFHYDLSPIKVTFTEQETTTGHFLTNLCTIIGGLFTVAGIVDLLLYKGLRATRHD